MRRMLLLRCAQAHTWQLARTRGLAFSIGLEVDGADGTRMDAEWPARAGRRRGSPHGMTGPVWQYGNVAR